MSLTLGLNSALSGLLTSQRAMDVIAQNVTNVNTKGYVRKVMNQESRVLNGKGAGVQEGSVTRMVNEGLLKDIRKQTAKLGTLEAQSEFYPRIDDLFGRVADNTSISHIVNSLYEAFETLGTQVNKPSIQWNTVQSAQDVTDLLDRMTSQLQSLRLEADRQIESTVQLINDKLESINDLNQKIVQNSAIATGTTDLEDKRDVALNDLAQYIDIQYYKRADNSVIVYTNSGEMLVDNQDQPLSYSANTAIDSWMTAAGGQFNKISVAGGTADLGPDVRGGKLKAYLDMRDKTVVDLQANLDELSVRMRETVNQVHNQGTSFPNAAYRYEGTRTFAKQGDIVPAANDAAMSIYFGATTLTNADFTDVTIAADATNPWQSTFTAAAGTPWASLSAGSTFSMSGSTDSRNDGTYRVVSKASSTVMTVEKVNVRQTMQLSGTDDVVISTFDSTGTQLQQTTLNTIMQTDYSGAYTAATAGTGRSLSDFQAKGSRDQWAINEVSAHVEAWLSAQGYTNASANLDSNGKMIIDLGDTGKSLVFRDQTSSTAGGTRGDATISFDVDGDGAVDQTVEGFSNFFGLNDFFTDPNQNSIFDSQIQPSSFETNAARDLKVLDVTGQLGPDISIPTGSSLSDIADLINRYTRTTESALLTSTSGITLSNAATITVSNSNGTVSTATIAAGATTLEEIAGKLTQGTVEASVIQDGAGYRLRLMSTSGQELTVAITGGTTSNGSSLASTLGMEKQNRISAAVVPEGSGYRLRIVQAESKEVYLSSSLDANNNNLLSEIGLERSATRAAGNIMVRDDLQTGAEKISRGAMQWNADLGQYYLSEGDNTVAMAMADAMNTKITMNSSGGIYEGKYSFAEFAAASISVVTRDAQHSSDQLDYQQTLNESLDFQYSSFSGVNLDEEVSSMVDFQQAYSAAAKVITVLQEMLQTLTDMIR